MKFSYRHLSILAAPCLFGLIAFTTSTGCGGSVTTSTGTTGTQTVTDLGVGFNPTGLNNSGQVIGTTVDNSGNTHAEVWKSGTATDLGNLGGTTLAVPTSINDNGIIVGYGMTSSSTTQAFGYVNGSMSALGALSGSTAQSEALGISPTAKIVGYASPSLNPASSNAVTWGTPSGPAVLVGALAGSNGQNYALAVNGTGTMIGASLMNVNQGTLLAEAEYWSSSGGTLTDLGVHAPETLNVNPVQTQAAKVNAGGEIAMMGNTTSDGTATDLVTITGGGQPVDQGPIQTLGGINSAGQIVGSTSTTAFLLDPTKGMIDLNTVLPTNSGVTLTAATGINDNEQVTCVGTSGGQIHGYLIQLPATLPKARKNQVKSQVTSGKG